MHLGQSVSQNGSPGKEWVGIGRSQQEDHCISTQIWDCEASSAFHKLEESVLCPLLFAAWLMPQMKA